MPRRRHDYTLNLEALHSFIDHVKTRGVRSYKGECPLPDGTKVPVDLVFDRGNFDRGQDRRPE